MDNKRSLETRSKSTQKKSEERIKKKRYVTIEHVSGSGKLEQGSSSGQQAMDADGSSDYGDDDAPVRRDEFGQWLKKKRSYREMRISDFSLCNLLPRLTKCEWSVVVDPGRYVTVDPGPLCLIEKISYVPNLPSIIPGNPQCVVYLGINRTRAESVIGRLIPQFRDEVKVHLLLRETFTVGHSGYDGVRFSGYKYVPQGHQERCATAPERPDKLRSTDPREWIIPSDITTQVFSHLPTVELAKAAELVCPFFGAAGHNPLAYSDIDLCKLRYGEDLIALMCIRRAGLKIKSLAVGFTYRPAHDFDLNRMYSGRFLEPLLHLGKGLRRLKLVGLDLIGPEHLTPVLAVCAALTSLELHKLELVPLDYAMSVAREHCINLLRFEYTSRKPDDGVFGAVSEVTLNLFLAKLPDITALRLCGVHLSDCQMVLIMGGFKKLRMLDLSDSSVFTGSFLRDLVNHELELEVLVCKRCVHLTEDEVREFFTNLREREMYFHKLEDLVITGYEHVGHLGEGFEGRIGRDALAVARPALNILAAYELVPPVVFDLADYERFISDSYNPSYDQDAVYNAEEDDWDRESVQVPDEELGGERYATLEDGSHRKRKMWVYWGKE